MYFPKSLVLPGLAIGLALSAGCAEKTTPVIPGTPFEVSDYAPDTRGYHTSWGHTGRGGAALRKPAWQPVVASPDTLETPGGKLHPELQPRSPAPASITVPGALRQSRCNDPQPEPVAQVFALGAQGTSERIVTLANGKGSVDDYIAVRNKLCKGALRLTYEEWLILVDGTPKDVPLSLQHPSSLSK